MTAASRGISPYAVYLKENWSTLKALKPRARIIKLAQKWNESGKDEKAPYIAKAQAAKSYPRKKWAKRWPQKAGRYQKFLGRHIKGQRDSGLSLPDRFRAAVKAWKSEAPAAKPVMQNRGRGLNQRMVTRRMAPQPKLLTGKVVVFTGKLSMPRAEATAMAERSGATAVSRVTKDTSVIVVGADSGSKLGKAVAKGIDVWSEADFIRKMTVEDHQERVAENRGVVIKSNKFEFSLAWDAVVDLDIHCKTPHGEVYCWKRNVGGANLPVDRRPCDGQTQWDVRPVEVEKLTPGDYEVFVHYHPNYLNRHKGPVPYTVHYQVGEVEDIFRGSLKKMNDQDTILKFKVGPSGNIVVGRAHKAAAAAKQAAKESTAKTKKKAAPKKAATAAKKKPSKATATTPKAKPRSSVKKTAGKKAPKKATAGKKVAKKAPAAKKLAKKAPVRARK